MAKTIKTLINLIFTKTSISLSMSLPCLFFLFIFSILQFTLPQCLPSRDVNDKCKKNSLNDSFNPAVLILSVFTCSLKWSLSLNRLHVANGRCGGRKKVRAACVRPWRKLAPRSRQFVESSFKINISVSAIPLSLNF